MHSFFNFGNFINFHFISLFFVASCNVFTLIFSSISFFCLFQVYIRYLYSSHPYYSFLICFSNPYFSSSIEINLVLNDLTSKPKLPIFRLTITIAWNISIVLLLLSTYFANFSTNFGVKFCGVSSLGASYDDIPMSLIYKPRSISNPCPSTDHALLCGNTMVGGLKSCIVGPSTSICCSWNECEYCCSIYGCGNCFFIGFFSWIAI